MDSILCIIVGIVVAILLVREKINQLSLQDDQDVELNDSEGNQTDSDEKLNNILKEIGKERDGSSNSFENEYNIDEILALLNIITYIVRNPTVLEEKSPLRGLILSSRIICSWLLQHPELLLQLSEEVLATIHQNAK